MFVDLPKDYWFRCCGREDPALTGKGISVCNIFLYLSDTHLHDMERTLTFFVFLFSTIILNAQEETHHWYFGTFAGLDFSGGVPVAVSGPMTTSEGTASMSNADGDLLFYTNGTDVYDSTHTIMTNGTGLQGDVSTSQVLIVPNPANANQYYIFTQAPDGAPGGLRYSIVDMSLNSGNGDVTATKNVLLVDNTCEKIAAIKQHSGDQYWVVVHKYGSDEFYAYLVTATGISAPVISAVGTVHNTSAIQNAYGQMKFNNCGDQLALAIGYQDVVELYDFDLLTGVVSNPVSLPMGNHTYGVEFSESSDYLYATCYDGTISQFDVTSGNQATILASKTTIALASDLYGMQMGPDGKIYVSRSFSSSYLGIINTPDLAGAGSDYVNDGINLDPLMMGNGGALSLPSFMQTYLAYNIICPETVGVSEERNEHFIVYPNPSAHDFLIGNTTGSLLQLSVFDASGKLVETKSSTGEIRFGAGYLPGLYLVQINRDGLSMTTEVMKK